MSKGELCEHKRYVGMCEQCDFESRIPKKCDHSTVGRYLCGSCVGEKRGADKERNRITDALEKDADKRGMLRDVTSTYFARAWREFAERLRKGEV